MTRDEFVRRFDALPDVAKEAINRARRDGRPLTPDHIDEAALRLYVDHPVLVSVLADLSLDMENAVNEAEAVLKATGKRVWPLAEEQPKPEAKP